MSEKKPPSTITVAPSITPTGWRVHQLLDLRDESYQVLYHFTVGGPVIDPRLVDLPAYGHLDHG